MPLGHALSEHEIGWHPGHRSGVLPADRLDHEGVAVSAAGTDLAARGAARDQRHQHGCGQIG